MVKTDVAICTKDEFPDYTRIISKYNKSHETSFESHLVLRDRDNIFSEISSTLLYEFLFTKISV